MRHSSRGNTYRDRGIRRLNTILTDYDKFVNTEQLYARITGTYDSYFRKLCSAVGKKVRNGIEKLADPGIHDESLSRIFDVARFGFLEYYHLIREVTQGAENVPRNIYFFADAMFDKLGRGKTPYLIKTELAELIPSTYELCRDNARRHLITFAEPSDYLKNMTLHIICLSPTIINNPLDWPLIGHEIAHILEKESLKIVQKRYPQLKPIEYSLSPSALAGRVSSRGPSQSDRYEPKWCLEIACDIIAATTFGPIYGIRLLENFHKPSELELSESHPFFKIRFKFIADELDYLGWKKEAKALKAKFASVTLPTWFSGNYAPTHWDRVRDEIRSQMKDKGLVYSCSSQKTRAIKNLHERLRELKPCLSIHGAAVDPRDILNATEGLEEQMKLAAGFRDFLADMIRLSATESVYSEKRIQAERKDQADGSQSSPK
jgi:hypothetical protein